jgi:chemotaxis protein histidine kinase CheA
MKSIKHQSAAAAMRIHSRDGFEELRETFNSRLKSERIRLVAISTNLGRHDADRAQLLDELRQRTHRLSGTAAIFELTGLSTLAGVVELAVISAVASPENNTDFVMRAALNALIRLLGSVARDTHIASIAEMGGAPRRAGAMHHS